MRLKVILLAMIFTLGCSLVTVTAPDICTPVQEISDSPKEKFQYVKTAEHFSLLEDTTRDTPDYKNYFFEFIAEQKPSIKASYFQSQIPGKKKLVIVLPIYGANEIPPEIMASRLTEWNNLRDTNVILIQERGDLFDWDILETTKSEQIFRESIRDTIAKLRSEIIGIRRIIDWVEEREEVDAQRIGIAGFSLGSMVATIVMGVDTRIAAGVFVMGGGNFHESFSDPEMELTKKVRKNAERNFAKNKKRLAEEWKTLLSTMSPEVFVGNINPAQALIFDAAYDEYIPQSARDRLWCAMHQPQRITFAHGHKISFLSMTIAGAHFTDRTIAEFFRKKL